MREKSRLKDIETGLSPSLSSLSKFLSRPPLSAPPRTVAMGSFFRPTKITHSVAGASYLQHSEGDTLPLHHARAAWFTFHDGPPKFRNLQICQSSQRIGCVISRVGRCNILRFYIYTEYTCIYTGPNFNHFSRFTFNNLNKQIPSVANDTRLAGVKNINWSGPGPGRAAASKVLLGGGI